MAAAADGLQKMDETIPKASEPSSAAAPLQAQQPNLPKKLSAQDFKTYNRLAEHMDMFHNHFRSTWNMLHGACTSGKRPGGMSIRAFIAEGMSFCEHLTMHHTIEERYVFPQLATKMEAFKQELELLTQHKEIHKGIDEMEAYLVACRSGERELRMGELKGIMDEFGKVLWEHLDDEVNQLRAENMAKYWSKSEMARLGI